MVKKIVRDLLLHRHGLGLTVDEEFGDEVLGGTVHRRRGKVKLRTAHCDLGRGVAMVS